MYTLRRFAPHLYATAVFAVFLWMYVQPQTLFGLIEVETFGLTMMMSIYAVLVVFLFATVFSIGYGRKLTSRIRFSYFPLLLLSSGYFLSLFTDYQPLLIALIGIVPVFSWFWLENIYLFWQRTALYQAYTLERLAMYFYVVTAFIFTYALTGAQVLVQIPFWSSMIIFSLGFGLLFFDSFLLHKYDPMESFLLSSLGVLLGGQLFFVLNLLPAEFSFMSSSMCLFYYLWSGLCRMLLARQKNKKLQATYITVSSVGFISILVSSLLVSI